MQHAALKVVAMDTNGDTIAGSRDTQEESLQQLHSVREHFSIYFITFGGYCELLGRVTYK